MLLFSIATPLGIGIAWAVTELAEAEESPWSAALTAVGAGTFLFVATIECAAPPLRPAPLPSTPSSPVLCCCCWDPLTMPVRRVIPAELHCGAADRGPKTAALVLGAVLMGTLAKWA